MCVGAREHETFFTAFQEDLVRHSEFFEAKYEGQGNADTLCARLPDCDPALFLIFCRFIKTGQLFIKQEGDKHPPERGVKSSPWDEEWDRLANVWLLGEELKSCSFKDAIVDAVIEKQEEDQILPMSMHSVIYPKSTAASKIRKLLIDVFVWGTVPGTAERQGRDPNLWEFYFDLAAALDKFKFEPCGAQPPYERGRQCLYHEHNQEGRECYKLMF